MARPLRIEYPGAVYHVVTRGNNRQVIFMDDHDRRAYLKKLHHYCEAKEAHLLCYCLLSNHVHLLIETSEANLSKLMQAFQTSYTVYFNRRHKQTGHVFEQRYKAFLVDKDKYLLQVSRYIHLNPVEAGLVKRPQDYRWSSYRGYLKDKDGEGLHRELILGQFGGGRRGKVAGYRDFVEGALKREVEWLPLPIFRQVFIGDEDFAEEVWRKATKEGELEGRYRLSAIIRRICEVVGIGSEELRKTVKEPRVREGRELLMYMGRRYSTAGLKEIAAWLGVRDISAISHGVKRAEARLKEDRGFRRQVEEVLRGLSNSRIQA